MKPPPHPALFFAAYCGFLAPVWAALWAAAAAETDTDTQREPLRRLAVPVVHHGGKDFVRLLSTWLGFILVAYVALRNFAGPLRLKKNDKSHATHMEDLLKLTYFGGVLGCCGGILTKLEHEVVNTQTGMGFIPLCAFYLGYYTLIFEMIKHENITLESSLATNKVGVVVVVMACTTLAGAVGSIFNTAEMRGPEFFTSFLFLVTLGVGVHLFTFWPRKPLVRGRHHLHIHHWYYGLALSHICPFATDVAMLTQAIFVAVMIHGSVIFGAEPIFYDVD